MVLDGYIWNLNTGLKYLDSAWIILCRQSVSSSWQMSGEIFFFFKWDNKTFGNLKQPIKLIKFSIFGCVLGSKNKYSLAKCYWFEIQRKTTLPLFNQLLCSSFSVICYWKILTQGCIFAEMRRENKSVSLTKQSLFSRWCLNRRLKTEELHLPTLAISITRSDSSHRRNAYKHMVGCGNSWGNRLTNNDSRRECSMQCGPKPQWFWHHWVPFFTSHNDNCG